MSEMKEYYALRAPVYEEVYAKPERQSELAQLKSWLANALSGKEILEIACGTGYWTRVMAETAGSVLATDINEPMLEVARQLEYPNAAVAFARLDMYDLPPYPERNALFGGFIWSHIAVQALNGWLDHLHGLLPPGSLFVFLDNKFVAGSSSAITHRDEHGNQFQDRFLPDGKRFQIIKNFPGKEALESRLKNRVTGLQIFDLQYFWAIQYKTAQHV